MRRSTVYVSLLVLGVAVEIALLRLGRGLETSPALEGEWDLRVDSARGEVCAPLAAGRTAGISIAQSGPDLAIDLPGTMTLEGTVDGTFVRAAAGAEAERRCASSAVFSARIDGSLPASMRGTIELPSGAGTVAFTARRAAKGPRR